MRNKAHGGVYPSKDVISKHLSYNPDTGEFVRLVADLDDYPGDDLAKKRLRGVAIRCNRDGLPVGNLDASGYVSISLLGAVYRAHRLAMILMDRYIDGLQVDHINGVRNDNRASNLRMVTPAQNSCNRFRSGQVEYDFDRRRWSARVRHNGKLIRIGRHRTRGLAMSAAIKWYMRHHGEYGYFMRNYLSSSAIK